MSYLTEFAACDAAEQRCCAPFRCWRGSGGYSQCGSACPVSSAWECHASPRVGLLMAYGPLGRMGPAWMPVLLKTLGAMRYARASAQPPVYFVSPPRAPPRVNPRLNDIITYCTPRVFILFFKRVGFRIG